jgi:hypothetical protein
VLVLAMSAPAGASVTLGQLATNPSGGCDFPTDFAQPTVISGNTYVVPGTGTITSWSHNAPTGPGQLLTMKVFRKVADPEFFLVVGHDGPRPLDAGLLNTFPASIPVKPGDFLGLHTDSAGTGCLFFASGDRIPARQGNLADGQAEAFDLSVPSDRLNVTAVFTPTNTFSVAKTTRNRKKGTATLTLDVPNPGELIASGKGVKTSVGAGAAKSVPSGTVKLVVRAKGKKRQTLNETGTVAVKSRITYTPTGGDPGSRSLKLKLRKKL